jgi:transposase
MNQHEQKNKDILISEFRYGIIADLTNPFLSDADRTRLIFEKSLREYEIPFSVKNRIGVKTISNWLKLYQKYGKNGLYPKVRKDFGKSRVFTEEEQSLIVTYLEEHPDVTAKAALKTLQQKGQIVSHPSGSSLSRFIVSNGLTRERRKEQAIRDKNLKFDFFAPLECVQADCMHAFPVPVSETKKKKAILLAFLDDATRRIVYSKFIDSENAIEFEAGIKHIMKAHGRIIKLYTDNGPQFVSGQSKRILDILGIRFIHSKPRRPQGRGKIERFFRTVRDQFLRPLEKDAIKNFDDLNIKFKTWLESEYHRNPHRGLQGKTPLEVWLAKSHLLLTFNPAVDLDEVCFHEVTRKVYNDNTFTLNGILYEAPGILVGKKVKIRFDPHKPVKEMNIYFEGKLWGQARLLDSYANTKVKRNADTKDYCDTSTMQEKNPTFNSISASRIGGTL